MQIERLGIYVYGPGLDESYDVPKWAMNKDGETDKYMIYAGGGNWYSMPLSSLDATELAGDCADYAETAGSPLTEEELDSLIRYFQDNDSMRVQKFCN